MKCCSIETPQRESSIYTLPVQYSVFDFQYFCVWMRVLAQQMDVEVGAVGTPRRVIVIGALRAEGCAAVMKCHDSEGWYSCPACACMSRSCTRSLKNTHFQPLSHALSYADTLSWQRSKTLTHSRTHSLHTVEEVYIQAWPRGWLIDK